MKRLNITKEQFEKSKYFKNKYGTLEYVSESGDVYKTDKGKVLKFVKEETDDDDEEWHLFKDRKYEDIFKKHAEEVWDAIWTLRNVDEELIKETGKQLIGKDEFQDIHNCMDLYMSLAPDLDAITNW